MSAVLVIDAHPNPESLCAALARRYADAARQAGASVALLSLRELAFDPVLHQGYRDQQPLEPDLQRAQRLVEASAHLCLVTPLWWGSVPALLKGFFDSITAVGDLGRFHRTAFDTLNPFKNHVSNRVWVFIVAFLISQKDTVSQPCSDIAHNRSLPLVAIATSAKHE